MSETVFRLYGKSNVGKSTTIVKTYNIFLSKITSAEILYEKRTSKEILVVIKTGKKIIGISSQGDAKKHVAKCLNLLNDYSCSVILTATRTRGGSVEAITDCFPACKIKKIKQKIVSSPDEEDISNNLMAKKLTNLIMDAI